MQVQDIAVSVTGKRVLCILPHSQDIGRFYTYTRLWQNPAKQLLQHQAKRTSEAIFTAAARISGADDIPLDHGFPVPSVMAGKQQSECGHSNVAHDVQPRVQLSLSLEEAALRMEGHRLERRISIVRPVRMKTAAAMATLDSAMVEYDRVAKTSAARAAAKKPSIAGSMLAQDIRDSSELREKLEKHVLYQDWCVNLAKGETCRSIT